MRKWGLHYLFVVVLMAAVMLAGCGAGDSNSAANTADSGGMDKGTVPQAAVTTNSSADKASSEAAVAGGGDANAVQNSTGENTSEGTSGFTGTDVVAGLNKKLIYHANLNMEVEDYAKAQTEVRNMITMAKGYIIQFTENRSEYEQGGTFVMKVPASGFSSFLGNLEKVKHETFQRSIEGQDVSEEYVDLESRLKAKQLMESRYIEFMEKATKSNDLVAFANQLGTIQEEIERIKGRMRYIDQNVSFSTVELRLYQTDESFAAKHSTEQGPLGERASDALKGSLNALSILFQWLVVILAAALPVLIIGGIIMVIVLVFFKKSIRRAGRTDKNMVDDRVKEEKKEE
jgi:hypothetical protein